LKIISSQDFKNKIPNSNVSLSLSKCIGIWDFFIGIEPMSSEVSFLPRETAHYSKSIGNLESLDANLKKLTHFPVDASNPHV